MHSTASFLFSVRFVSDAALLRSLLCLVCRSSDSSIQAVRIIAACDLAPYCQRIASAFSPGHDSPSNDRFSPHAGISRMENNTLESQLLSESCRVLAISNVQTAILRYIPSVSGIYTRFPCSANKHACSICRAGQGQSFHLDEATSVLRVAHVPQKPWYVILGTIAVVSTAQLSPYGSPSVQSFPFRLKPGKRCRRSVHQFAARIGTRTIRKPLHLTYQRFCCLALLRQNRVRSIKRLPLLS